ncbi:DNA repair and recombination protein RAD54-like (Fragment) [Seminavis robusta]|uniref:DNA repair and recombination protein RAD54-like n=1 Tax=Seminavis robusta TaxID=568900 RepID=A0A9N8HIM3_9STRA
MYLKRPKTPNNDSSSCGGVNKSCSVIKSNTSSRLFQPGKMIMVQRAPMFAGLSVQSQKKFQRPMLKRRAYGRASDDALRRSSLGPKRRMDGMAKLMARAGKGLTFKGPRRLKDDDDDDGGESDENDKENAKEPEKPTEPLRVWQSPHLHEDVEPRGIPSTVETEQGEDEYGIAVTRRVEKEAPKERYSKKDVFVPTVLAKWLRPHQREGVQFMYECVMGLKKDSFEGNGCILADDMGLGKTLQSVALIYTLLKTGLTANGAPTARRVIVVCPCSLVKNWENEFIKWLGPGVVKTLAIAEADRASVEKNLDAFVRTKLFNVLVASYECIRAHVGRLIKHPDCCDLLVCDEAHRLKNRENQTSRALNSLPVKRRVLLTGTPMQNDLEEFFAMVDFTNQGVLGTPESFRKHLLGPILRGREPDATDKQKQKMIDTQAYMSGVVNHFILRRVNTLNAQHLPPKLVQVVCCNLTDIQRNMYEHLINSKAMHHVLKGKQVNCLGSIQMLMKLCNHPSLIAEENDSGGGAKAGGRRAASKKRVNYNDAAGDKEEKAAPGAAGISKFLPFVERGGSRSMNAPIHPEWSGKMFVLYRLMREMRKPGNGNDKIVIVSNYTQTLDLIGRMCRESSWGFCRLDGSISMKKRQKMVDEFNDPSSSLIAFLLSSKAGGCGLNLIGGNRLVLFDPDWNPAVDKQAAARCWRDGQKKRCFTYRFLATGTVEEKIFQRQLSKEGLQSVVDDKEQVNTLSTKDLRNLFKLRAGTPSDTHDKLRCERCEIIHDNAEAEALKKLPKQLVRCRQLLDEMVKEEDASFFLKPMVSQNHGVSTEEWEKIVKQPMDFGTIRTRLAQTLATQPPKDAGAAAAKPKQSAAASTYKNVSDFSKDVNRIFSNCLKVWEPEKHEIADAARRLQARWTEQWTLLVPELMTMKADDDEVKAKSGAEDDDDDILGCEAPTNNERGEDFQEQLGMPDEENMRSWSHHYSADTVDDPVFRAAMRGYDSVSFVFGLEVTWSLIQQRKQEEEEAEAMAELEAVRELEEAEKAADQEGSGDEDDAKPSANTGTTESDGEESNDEGNKEGTGDGQASAGGDEGDKDMDDEESADDDNESLPIGDESAENSDEAGVASEEDQDEEMEPTETDTAEESANTAEKGPGSPPDNVSGPEVSSSPPPEQQKNTRAASPPSVQENEPPIKGGWQCEMCTMKNEKGDFNCSMCDAAKPETPKKNKRRRRS